MIRRQKKKSKSLDFRGLFDGLFNLPFIKIKQEKLNK